MRPVPIAVFTVTALLFANSILVVTAAPIPISVAIAMAGPILLGWLAFSVLHDHSAAVRRLGDDHWGYQDRPELRPQDRGAAEP